MGELIGESRKYSDADLEALVEKATSRGAVLSVVHFDAHGKDAEAVKNSLVELVAKLSKEKGMIYCRGQVEEALESENLYSSCAEVKVLVGGFNDLVNVALKYGPIAVEIVKPNKITLPLDEAQNIIVDASKISQEYAKFILEKTLSGEELQRFQKQLVARAEFGKKLLEKA